MDFHFRSHRVGCWLHTRRWRERLRVLCKGPECGTISLVEISRAEMRHADTIKLQSIRPVQPAAVANCGFGYFARSACLSLLTAARWQTIRSLRPQTKQQGPRHEKPYPLQYMGRWPAVARDKANGRFFRRTASPCLRIARAVEMQNQATLKRRAR